jgi:hypothetical protein
LTRFSIRVKGKTKAWATSEFSTDVTKSRPDIILDKSNKALNVPLSAALDDRKVILGPAIQGTAPTFQTYNIARTYVVRLTVDIRCADVVFAVSEDMDLVILPGIGDYPSPPSGRLHGGVDVLDIDDLPSYVQATSSIAQTLVSILTE